MMQATLLKSVTEAGAILRKYFGKTLAISFKGDYSNIVTDADMAAEQWIIQLIRQRHPQDGILGEETGFKPGTSDVTWVIDPLDGTSNFAAGIPWFGVLLAVLQGRQPVMAAMYLPDTDVLYFAETGRGVLRNQQAVRMTTATDLRTLLCAYSLDGSADELKTRREVAALERLINRVRNVRATNCLLDFCYTIDGRLGACVNQSTKIWDIAGASLMFREAGGLLTDFQGRETSEVWDLRDPTRNYSVIGASRTVHPQVLAVINGS
jgi:myo-inositol-1(or 4)-monophosphatase